MKKIVRILPVFIAIAMALLWILGNQLSAPAQVAIGQPPENTSFEPVEFGGVHGWYLQGEKQKSCVLLMHGIRSNRREMMPRALFLSSKGYSSLAIDLQAHGESQGEQITFGYKEAESARKAVSYLREQKACKKIIALGSSLGGAAALLGASPLEVEGYVLEAVYTDIETAVRNRLSVRAGSLGAFFAPLLYEQIPLKLDITLDQLHPVNAIKHIQAPVLIMNGTNDDRTTPLDATLLYKNAPEPKQLVWFDGARHTNLFEYDRKQYVYVLVNFLELVDSHRT